LFDSVERRDLGSINGWKNAIPTLVNEMRFLCLGYLNMEQFDAAPEDVKNEILSNCFAQVKTMRATGKVIEEEGLQHYRTSKAIRSRGGKRSVTDGPFIETKEQLGSHFVIEADSIEEAVEIASLHPAATFGEEYGFGIEVRPIQ
jgi:hypothetical protein